MTYSDFEGDIEILAVRADRDDLIAISVYEKGAKILKGTTKARHVNIWPHSTGWQMVTDDGWELIHRSILYALGQIPFDVAPEENSLSPGGRLKRCIRFHWRCYQPRPITEMPIRCPEIPSNRGASARLKRDEAALSRHVSNSALLPLSVHPAQCR